MSQYPINELTCSTREAARALGISVRTAQLWVEEGRLNAWKTPGGHRRILRSSVERILDEQKQADRYRDDKLNVLILDVDAAHGERLRDAILKAYPASTVSLVADSYDVLMKIGELPPDLLIMDRAFACQEDYRLLNALGRSSHMRSMLLIIQSDADLSDPAIGQHIPVESLVLSKPLDVQEVQRLIRAYIQGSQAKRSL